MGEVTALSSRMVHSAAPSACPPSDAPCGVQGFEFVVCDFVMCFAFWGSRFRMRSCASVEFDVSRVDGLFRHLRNYPLLRKLTEVPLLL